ncbi:MotE family protein [Pontivivens ytuae]|uniref:Magnesium transporter MgtE intracellular domain-containing protein n=1 Tax=Pontivivens ytuae TaxID=2789856 RepID=A0A7S9LQ54_9RHOB|nr:hypothetical protein [Pontivivens ytuae]QPH53187.1 hypothetical protein I0K15_15480 [Pontivivens ytuae]
MRRRGPRTLALVAAVLLLSAGLRVSDNRAGFGELLSGWIGAAQATPTIQTEPDPEAENSFLAALQARESELDARALELAARAQEIAAAEDNLRAQLRRLEEAEADLAETLQRADGAAEADVQRVVAVYENMRAANAAPLFEQMQPDFAAGFLIRMAPDKAAEILAAVDASQAYAISAIMAGRNARAPRQ